MTLSRKSLSHLGGEPARKEWDVLPFGPFSPDEDRTLEIGLRRWVRTQTELGLGYVEQLYTFGDRGRHTRQPEEASRMVLYRISGSRTLWD